MKPGLRILFLLWIFRKLTLKLVLLGVTAKIATTGTREGPATIYTVNISWDTQRRTHTEGSTCLTLEKCIATYPAWRQ